MAKVLLPRILRAKYYMGGTLISSLLICVCPRSWLQRLDTNGLDYSDLAEDVQDFLKPYGPYTNFLSSLSSVFCVSNLLLRPIQIGKMFNLVHP